MEKLKRLVTAIHRHNKTELVEERRMHDMVVAATLEDWSGIKTHTARMVAILEMIIREGSEVGELKVDDPGAAARAVETALNPVLPPDPDPGPHPTG